MSGNVSKLSRSSDLGLCRGAVQMLRQDVEEAISKGELGSFMEAMGVSTDDVWTAGAFEKCGNHFQPRICYICYIDLTFL